MCIKTVIMSIPSNKKTKESGSEAKGHCTQHDEPGLIGLPPSAWMHPLIILLRQGRLFEGDKTLDEIVAAAKRGEIPPPYTALAWETQQAALAVVRAKFVVLQNARLTLQPSRPLRYYNHMRAPHRGIFWQVCTEEDNFTNNLSTFFTEPMRWRAMGLRPGSGRALVSSEDTWRSVPGKVLHCAAKRREDKRITLSDMSCEMHYVSASCPFFRPVVAKSVMETLGGGRVLDMSAGWGDRLAAALASERITAYTGVDPNASLHPAYRCMERTLAPMRRSPCRVTLHCAPFEDVDLGGAEFDVAFTSPPFFKREVYVPGDPTQSVTRYGTLDDWLRGFLWPSIAKAAAHLIPGGKLALALADYEGCPFLARTMEEVRDNPSRYYLEEVGTMGFAQHGSKRKNPQPIFVWRRSSRKRTASPGGGGRKRRNE